MKQLRHYKNKTYYYISYASQGFVDFNPQYKVGITIAELEMNDQNMFVTKKFIESVNTDKYGPNHPFLPSTLWCVIGYDKKDVIEQIFTKEWYRP